MKLHIIRSPLAHASRSSVANAGAIAQRLAEKTALAAFNKGGTRKTSIKVPLFKGDLGGSRYMELHIKLV